MLSKQKQVVRFHIQKNNIIYITHTEVWEWSSGHAYLANRVDSSYKDGCLSDWLGWSRIGVENAAKEDNGSLYVYVSARVHMLA